VQLDRTVWDSMSKRVMLELMLAQYAYLEAAGEVLQATGRAVLVEGNTWGDYTWGAITVDKCPQRMMGKLPNWGYSPVHEDVLVGHNWLGQLLMAARLVLS